MKLHHNIAEADWRSLPGMCTPMNKKKKKSIKIPHGIFFSLVPHPRASDTSQPVTSLHPTAPAAAATLISLFPDQLDSFFYLFLFLLLLFPFFLFLNTCMY